MQVPLSRLGAARRVRRQNRRGEEDGYGMTRCHSAHSHDRGAGGLPAYLDRDPREIDVPLDIPACEDTRARLDLPA